MKVVIQILATWLFKFVKRIFVFGSHFATKDFLNICSFCYHYGSVLDSVQVSYRNFYGKVLKNGLVHACAQAGVKSSLGKALIMLMATVSIC